MNPQELRALADKQPTNYPWSADAALRDAADRLDAVQTELHDILNRTEDMPDAAYRRLFELHFTLTTPTVQEAGK